MHSRAWRLHATPSSGRLASGIEVANLPASNWSRSQPMRRSFILGFFAVAMGTSLPALAQDPNCPPGAWFCEEADVQPPPEAAPPESPEAKPEPKQEPGKGRPG